MNTSTYEALESLERCWEESTSPEERERLLLAMDALRFVLSTGQTQDFKEYRESLEADAPPLVIAAFDTREEADAWLKSQPRPPHQAYVLLGGEYHVVMYAAELNRRRLVPHPVLKFYLAEMIQDGVPASVATFATREEAQTWLEQRASPPLQVFITVAGEPHLVVYHHRVRLRAMYPLSMAAKVEPRTAARN